MKEFKRYPKLRHPDDEAVQGIMAGKIHIFPKLDGTNASVWWGERKKSDIEKNLNQFGVCAGSRNRQLALGRDNAGFYETVLGSSDFALNLHKLLYEYPEFRLYGEWLVPHSLKTYRESAWRTFYVFDVMENDAFMPFDEYVQILEDYNIPYISPMKIEANATIADIQHLIKKNKYLIKEGHGYGEGIVVKNYSFVNKFGDVTWMKMVSNSFKEVHTKEMGAPEVNRKSVEQEVAQKFVTRGRVDKIIKKIEIARGDTFKKPFIPELLGRVEHDVISEESWNFIQEHNHPVIDFTNLKQYIINEIKNQKPDIFA